MSFPNPSSKAPTGAPTTGSGTKRKIHASIRNPYAKPADPKSSFDNLIKEIKKFEAATEKATKDHEKLLVELKGIQTSFDNDTKKLVALQNEKGQLAKKVEHLERQYPALEKSLKREREVAKELVQGMVAASEKEKRSKKEYCDVMNIRNGELKKLLQEREVIRLLPSIHPETAPAMLKAIGEQGECEELSNAPDALAELSQAGERFEQAREEHDALQSEILHLRQLILSKKAVKRESTNMTEWTEGDLDNLESQWCNDGATCTTGTVPIFHPVEDGSRYDGADSLTKHAHKNEEEDY